MGYHFPNLLTNPTINGTIATTGLTLPAITLGGAVTLGGQFFDAGGGDAQINTTGAWSGLVIQQTNDGDSSPIITFKKISASPAVNDVIGSLGY